MSEPTIERDATGLFPQLVIDGERLPLTEHQAGVVERLLNPQPTMMPAADAARAVLDGKCVMALSRSGDPLPLSKSWANAIRGFGFMVSARIVEPEPEPARCGAFNPTGAVAGCKEPAGHTDAHDDGHRVWANTAPDPTPEPEPASEDKGQPAVTLIPPPTTAQIAAHMRAGKLVVGAGHSGRNDPILLSLAEVEAGDPDEVQPTFVLCDVPDPRLAPTPPAESLPPGVPETKRIGLVEEAGGGWVRVLVDRDLDQYPDVGAEVLIEVRPVPEPETELVPLHKLIGRTVGGFGEVHSFHVDEPGKADVVNHDLGSDIVPVDSAGMVRVLTSEPQR